jgi:flagellar biosynthesis/type III secretory pathway protein FliH
VSTGIARARVIKAAFPTDASTRRGAEAHPLARRIPADVMDAREEAARIVAAARAEADRITRAARESGARAAEEAAREAREREIARVAAEAIAVRTADERRAERELDRTVGIAALLAERLVGEAIRVEPERIAALANEALCEARGARRVRVEASPEDAPVLARVLAEVGAAAAEVVPNPELGRGSLLVLTELGRIDARLAPQLERLSEAVREAMRAAT